MAPVQTHSDVVKKSQLTMDMYFTKLNNHFRTRLLTTLPTLLYKKTLSGQTTHIFFT